MVDTNTKSISLNNLGIKNATVRYQLTSDELHKETVEKGQGIESSLGAIAVNTGEFTGRSPKDRFIVKDEVTKDEVWWSDINIPFDSEKFDALYDKVVDYLSEKEIFVRDSYACADDSYKLNIRVVNEYPWSNMFAYNMFLRPTEEELKDFSPEWTVVNAPGFMADPDIDGTRQHNFAILNFSKKIALIGGTGYTGEIKKGIFSALNFILPVFKNTLPMHCSANVGKDGDTAIFFGLSGTGKTTLSTDPDRSLIGDDEHGWSDKGIFNFEGGCYAKCIDLSEEREPVIWHAIADGAVMENVVIDEAGDPDYADSSNTQNTRVAYPLSHIAQRVPNSQANPPKVVVFLTCDLFGVLPPVSRLTETQAAYYFLSGYTALVGSTEMGSAPGVSTTFSTCFGAPFFPRPASVYADLLMKRVSETGASVYLVNTGWTGGGYGKGGKRFAIPTTRAIITSLISGSVKQSEWEVYSGFGFEIPTSLEGVETDLLNPEKTWEDKASPRDQGWRSLMPKPKFC